MHTQTNEHITYQRHISHYLFGAISFYQQYMETLLSLICVDEIWLLKTVLSKTVNFKYMYFYSIYSNSGDQLL